MTTEPLNGRTVLTAFSNEGGVPVVPQPPSLDYVTDYGVILLSADGKMEAAWYPQIPVPAAATSAVVAAQAETLVKRRAEAMHQKGDTLGAVYLLLMEGK